jgi:hypothetical protein
MLIEQLLSHQAESVAPCGFCGVHFPEAVFDCNGDKTFPMTHVAIQCGKCGARGSFVWRDGICNSEAVARAVAIWNRAWNRRDGDV